jgi:hypothetical protein
MDHGSLWATSCGFSVDVVKSGKEMKHTSQPCIPEEYPVQTELMVADRSVFSFFVFFLWGFYSTVNTVKQK